MSNKQKVLYNGGRWYEVENKDEKFHGQGTYTWDDLNEYLSEWNDGVPVEQGIFPFLDGRKYVVEWKNGEQNG